MKFIFTGTFNIDFDRERKRLHKCFSKHPKTLARQLKIINLFEQEKFKEAIEAYNSLPYSKIDECPEQEYTGLWFSDIISGIMYAKFEHSGCRLEK